jgi:hypothetical protein
MVIQAAKTGKLIINNKLVNQIDQGNKLLVKPRKSPKSLPLLLKMVEIKFIEPNILDTPAKCKLKKKQSTLPLFKMLKGT